MNSDFLLICINTVGSLTVLWSSICAANYMSLKTSIIIRIAYIALGVGAAAALLTPGYLQRPPTIAELMLVCGMALLTIGERRRHPFVSIRHA